MSTPEPPAPTPSATTRRHTLKVWPLYGNALDDGSKTFEFRRDDRTPRYEVGDLLHLREWMPSDFMGTIPRYTGREWLRRVTYVARGGVIPEGYCVMSIVPPASAPAATAELIAPKPCVCGHQHEWGIVNGEPTVLPACRAESDSGLRCSCRKYAPAATAGTEHTFLNLSPSSANESRRDGPDAVAGRVEGAADDSGPLARASAQHRGGTSGRRGNEQGGIRGASGRVQGAPSVVARPAAPSGEEADYGTAAEWKAAWLADTTRLKAAYDAQATELAALHEELQRAYAALHENGRLYREADDALAALRARVEELETPDIMGDADGVGYFEDDYDCLVDDAPVGTIREVWANRTLGQRWIARIPTNDEDFETRVFDSLADAQRAVADARAALAPRQTTEGHEP